MPAVGGRAARAPACGNVLPGEAPNDLWSHGCGSDRLRSLPPSTFHAARDIPRAVRRNAVVHGRRGKSPLLAAAGGSGGTPKNVGSESDIGLDPALGDGEGDPRGIGPLEKRRRRLAIVAQSK